ncbi:MAG: glycoside hydrolase family 97 catalytic domain-containing protein [Candidatus Pristimantibacillus sp.]
MNTANAFELHAPDGKLHAIIEQQQDGTLTYSVQREQSIVLARSPLGLQMGNNFASKASELTILHVERSTLAESYELTTGKQRKQSYEANELLIHTSMEGQPLLVRFRAFNDAIAIRYELPDEGTSCCIAGEHTGFQLPEQPLLNVWAQPFMRCYERTYDHAMPEHLEGGHFGFPLLAQLTENNWLLLTEAAVYGTYGSCHLTADPSNGRSLQIAYAPDQTDPIDAQLPLTLPWRVIMNGTLNTLVCSAVTTHLNPPSVVTDLSWIRPGRAAWSWYADGDSCGNMTIQQQHVDFAAQMGWEYSVADGGWEDVLDAPGLIAYAQERNVGIWVWTHYKGLETASLCEEKLSLCASWGAVGIKVDFFDSDSQQRIQTYDLIAEAAAKYRLMVNFHGSTKPSGVHRRWPHIMTYEGVYGAEYYRAHSEGPNAVHLCTLPFTRNIIGSMDYTPVTFSKRTNTTAGLQLALAVLFESGVQHFADAISIYADHPAQSLLASVPAAWDETMLIDGYPGRFVTIARRSDDQWYVASICATGGKLSRIPLSFLNKERQYEAMIYEEAAEPDEYRFRAVLPPITIRREVVTATDSLSLQLKVNGGVTIHISPIH